MNQKRFSTESNLIHWNGLAGLDRGLSNLLVSDRHRGRISNGALAGRYEHALNFEHEVCEERPFLTKHFRSLWRHLSTS